MPSELTTSLVTNVGDDLAPQAVLAVELARGLDDAAREVAAQHGVERRVVGNRRGEHLGIEAALGVGEQHRQLGPRQPAALALALGQLVGRRQRLELAVEQALELQLVHQHLVGLDALRRGLLLLAEDLRLQVVVVEHELADLVGRRGEQLVAPVEREPLALDARRRAGS